MTARKENYLTQKQISEMLNVTTRTYYSLESGRSNGSLKLWLKLRELLGKPIDYLIQQ